MISIDYNTAKKELYSLYDKAIELVDWQNNHLTENFLDEDEGFAQKIAKSELINQLTNDNNENLDIVFKSGTKSFREVLLGCAIARYIDLLINIRLPYTEQGDNAFSGRSLDEKVINPFLQEQKFPCSNGPNLAVFRRQETFTMDFLKGKRDKKGYIAMLSLLDKLERCKTNDECENFILMLMMQFIILREAESLNVVELRTLRIEQYRNFLTELIKKQSGGLIISLVSVAFFQAINDYLKLNWEINWKGINVSDKAKGDEGDIVIKLNNKTILAVEVTERQIDKNRIESTINSKILTSELKRYLFIYSEINPNEEAIMAAKKYFANEIEINFANIIDLIINCFLTFPVELRQIFSDKLYKLITSPGIFADTKIKWNETIQEIIHTF